MYQLQRKNANITAKVPKTRRELGDGWRGEGRKEREMLKHILIKKEMVVTSQSFKN